MPKRYQDIYPSRPLLDSATLGRPSAADLLTLEYFEAGAAEMPTDVYAQHHILLNLHQKPRRVENWRDDEHHDYMLVEGDIVVTPAGVRSGWRWFETSSVIIVTLDPDKLERFAQSELGVLLSGAQLKNLQRFNDPDICQAGVQLRDVLADRGLGSEVMFESLARVFLIKLIQKYGDRHDTPEFASGFSAKRYKRVLDYIAAHFGQPIELEALAREAALSASHFSRQFKETVGQSPMRFVASYRVEQARKMMLADRDRSLLDIALSCGFADQAHFSRVFKQIAGATPASYRASLTV